MAWEKEQLLQSGKGKYKIVREIGHGGYGITYLAKDLVLKKQVVIKRPRPDLHLREDYEKYVRRFEREGKVLTQINHPNVVRAIKFFQDEGMPCLVMEYVECENLYDYIRRKQYIPPDEALVCFRKLTIALQTLHQQHLIHCDIHPGNIILDQSGKPVLIDFGSVKLLEPHTLTGTTCNDFSPYEQEDCSDPKPTLDVYSLAATLYFVITGKKPQPANARKMFGDRLIPPKQHRSDVSEELNLAIIKGMALEAENRPSTMQEWINLLPVISIVPKVFKVLSMQPEIKITWVNIDNDIIKRKKSKLLIFFVLALTFLISHKFIVLKFGYSGLFMIVITILLIILIVWIATGTLLLFPTIHDLWTVLGSTQFSASKERLSTTYNLLGFCCQKSISATDISYLELFNKAGSHDYDLDIIGVNSYQSESRLFLEWVPIIRNKGKKSRNTHVYRYKTCDLKTVKWLGDLLSDFYQVELRSYTSYRHLGDE